MTGRGRSVKYTKLFVASLDPADCWGRHQMKTTGGIVSMLKTVHHANMQSSLTGQKKDPGRHRKEKKTD